MTDTEEAPGWDAIDLALNAWYDGIEPRHVGYTPPAAFSNNLQGCSAYPADGHWHYVTYGLSELFQPHPDDDPEVSGWGFELTFRLARRPDEREAPGWPFGVLNQLAQWVNTSSVVLEPGLRIDLRRAITGHPDLPEAPPTGLTVFALTVDSQLGTIDTPHGKVVFLQAVGVTEQEKAVMLQSSTAAVLDELAAGNPLLITDPGRA